MLCTEDSSEQVATMTCTGTEYPSATCSSLVHSPLHATAPQLLRQCKHSPRTAGQIFGLIRRSVIALNTDSDNARMQQTSMCMDVQDRQDVRYRDHHRHAQRFTGCIVDVKSLCKPRRGLHSKLWTKVTKPEHADSHTNNTRGRLLAIFCTLKALHSIRATSMQGQLHNQDIRMFVPLKSHAWPSCCQKVEERGA